MHIDLSERSAWIGSLQYTLVFLPAVAVGRIFDLGHFRIPFFCGSAALVVAPFLVAQCKEYWEFILAHGILVGVRTLPLPHLSLVLYRSNPHPIVGECVLLRPTDRPRRKLVREETWDSVGYYGFRGIPGRHHISYHGTEAHPNGRVSDTYVSSRSLG